MKNTPFALGLLVCAIGALCACTPDSSEDSDPHEEQAAAPEDVQRALDPRPSVVLVVLDTVRADAVSAYGAVDGTTPTFDALAARGTRFARAYAPAPWTVSSHASLFSGLRVDEHGVGLGANYYSEDALEMLAEEFRAAGYVTAGFSENALVSADFGLDQGFDSFAAPRMADIIRSTRSGDTNLGFFGLARRVRAWNRSRDRTRPYFVFVNIMDAHDPYLVRDENPWVPTTSSRAEIESVAARYVISSALCRKAPTARHQAVLKGLYLGDVRAADQKLADVLRALDFEDASPGGSNPRITIVTSDHGEHLGEHGLSGHRFSVRTPVLHVPLAVSGVEGLAGGVVEAAVELRSVRQSLSCWALGQGCPAELGAPIPSEAEDAAIFSIWSQGSDEMHDPIREQLEIPKDTVIPGDSLGMCSPADRVFGDLVSMIRYPMKMNWYEGQPPTLHDLSWDPLERSDLVNIHPDLAETLGHELEAFARTRVAARRDHSTRELSEEAIQKLKALGYVD